MARTCNHSDPANHAPSGKDQRGWTRIVCSQCNGFIGYSPEATAKEKALARFLDEGRDIRLSTVQGLADYLGLEFCKRGATKATKRATRKDRGR